MSDRRELPEERPSITRRFEVPWPRGDPLRFYVTVSLYDDGSPGEIIFHADTMGKFPHGILRALGMAASLALQHGATIERIIRQWRGTRFPPEGFTRDPEFPRCKSILDLVGQWLEVKFVRKDEEVAEEKKDA